MELVTDIQNMNDLIAPRDGIRFVFYARDTATTSGIPPVTTNDIRAFVFLFNWANVYHFQVLMSANYGENKTWTRSSIPGSGWSNWAEK